MSHSASKKASPTLRSGRRISAVPLLFLTPPSIMQVSQKKSPCPYGQGRHTRYHLALYLGLSLTRTNASLTDFNEVLSGDTLLFHTGSHHVRLSVISKSSLLLILACLYVEYYRAEEWTLSSGHRKDLSNPSSGVNSHAFLPSIVSVCCARSPHSSTHRYRPR